jgi:hypothetical protein
VKYRKERCKVGDTVRIRFWDHRKNDTDAKEYFAYGRVHHTTKRAITIDYWATIDPDDPDREPDNNTECHSLMRKVITELLVLVPKEPGCGQN